MDGNLTNTVTPSEALLLNVKNENIGNTKGSRHR